MQSFLEIDRWVVYERESRPAHCVHVIFLVSRGKFTCGLDFSGQRFFFFRGALSLSEAKEARAQCARFPDLLVFFLPQNWVQEPGLLKGK